MLRHHNESEQVCVMELIILVDIHTYSTYISLVYYHFLNVNTLVHSHFKATVEADFFPVMKIS